MFRIEILTTPDGRAYNWKYLHPTNGKPYEYNTRREAQDVIDMCYPMSNENTVRVKEMPIDYSDGVVFETLKV